MAKTPILAAFGVMIPRTQNERIQQLCKKYNCTKGCVIRAAVKFFIKYAKKEDKKGFINQSKLVG